MRKCLVIAFIAIISSIITSAQPQAKAARAWKPAVYKGLIIGESTKEDAVRTLGRPHTSGKEPDTGLPIITFDVLKPLRGSLVVYLKNGLVDGITLLPEKRLTRRDAVKMFGSDYLRVRYASDDCLTDGGSAPIFESPAGAIEHLEYRKRGQALVLHDGAVEAIVFVHKPFGPIRSQCLGTKDKKTTDKKKSAEIP